MTFYVCRCTCTSSNSAFNDNIRWTDDIIVTSTKQNINTIDSTEQNDITRLIVLNFSTIHQDTSWSWSGFIQRSIINRIDGDSLQKFLVFKFFVSQFRNRDLKRALTSSPDIIFVYQVGQRSSKSNFVRILSFYKIILAVLKFSENTLNYIESNYFTCVETVVSRTIGNLNELNDVSTSRTSPCDRTIRDSNGFTTQTWNRWRCYVYMRVWRFRQRI